MAVPDPRDGQGWALAEQTQAYRRGFILGVTLAEVALLLVFVLLLLLILQVWEMERSEMERPDITREAFAQIERDALRLRELAEKWSGKSELDEDATRDALTEMERDALRFRELAEKWTGTSDLDDDDFQVLVRAAETLRDSSEWRDALHELRETQIALDETREQLAALLHAAESDGAQIATRLQEQQFELANQRGQLRHLREQLAKSGAGGVLPPCWASPDGRPEYLLAIALTPAGIRVTETVPPGRMEERALLPLEPFGQAEILSPSAFLQRTSALFRWSEDRECRFYVRVTDETGPEQKVLYKTLLRAVEGHFYKLLVDSGMPR